MNSDNGLLLISFCIYWATLLYLISKSKNKKYTLFINGLLNIAYSAYFVYGLLYESDGGASLIWWAYLLCITWLHWLIIVIMIVYLTLKKQPKPSYKMTLKQNFKLIGLKLDKKTFNANGQAAVDCGSLWQRFMGDGIANKIPSKTSENLYAV